MTLSLITALLSSLYVTVSNPLPEQRSDVPVVVPIPTSAGEVRSVKVAGVNDMPYQLDDMNGDGVADEIVVMLDMKPGETRTLTLNLSTVPDTTATFEAGTYAYLKLNDKNKNIRKSRRLLIPETSTTARCTTASMDMVRCSKDYITPYAYTWTIARV